MGKHWAFIVPQYTVQILFMSYLIIVTTFHTKSVTFFESALIIYTVLARSFIIAVRYGFISEARYKLYYSKATANWVAQDLLVLGWLKMSPKTVQEQINATKHRLKIYDEDWMFYFIEKLPKDLDSRLSDDDYYDNDKYNENIIKQKIRSSKNLLQMRRKKGASFIGEDLDLIHQAPLKSDNEEGKNHQLNLSKDVGLNLSVSEDEENGHDANRSYKAESILREMLLLDSANVGMPKYLKCIVLLRIVLQVASQFYHNDRSFVFHWYEYLVTSWYLFTLFYLYGANLIFIVAGMVDFKRKLFLMKIMQSLITPDKDEDFMFSKYFPTINIC